MCDESLVARHVDNAHEEIITEPVMGKAQLYGDATLLSSLRRSQSIPVRL
jgi:hypothetical protein